MAVAQCAADARSAVGSGDQSVASWWSALVDANPGAVAVRSTEQADIPLSELDHRSADLARALLLAGYGKGSRIGLLIGNGADWIVAWLATQRIGAVAVFISTLFAEQELRHALRHADVQLLLVEPAFLHHDYLARLEAAFPDLASQDGGAPVLMDEAPFLRAIWTNVPAKPRWVATDMKAAERRGEELARHAPGLLSSAEAEVVGSDLSVIIYTSGSTAHPKAVMHRQAVIADKIRFVANNNAVIPAETTPGDRVLVTIPLFWVGGFLSCFGALERGASVAFAPALPAPELWETIERTGATHVTGGDAMLRSLQDYLGPDRPLSGYLKPQNSNQMAWFRAAQGYDPDRIGSAFGMTETMGPHSGFRDIGETYGAQAGSVGWALGDMERRIADPVTGNIAEAGAEGELLVKGPWLMEGYYKQPRDKSVDADGFFHTGDRCFIDGADLLHFVGRDSGMIKTSGANVAPEEVEAALRQSDDVVEAVVIGMPDAARGQVVVAFVAPRPGADIDEAVLRTWLRPRLSSFKIPRRFLFMPFDDMPRTSSNKIHRGELARLAEAQASVAQQALKS